MAATLDPIAEYKKTKKPPKHDKLPRLHKDFSKGVKIGSALNEQGKLSKRIETKKLEKGFQPVVAN